MYKNRYTAKEIAYQNDSAHFLPHPIHFIRALFREPALIEYMDIPPLFPNPIHYIWLLFKKPKPIDKSGICLNCHKNVQNLGAHIDYCLDSNIWKK